MKIRPTTAGQIDFLHIGEIYLYAADGSPITPLAATLSTTYSSSAETFPASNCIDNDTATTCGTFSGSGDPNPRLAVQYNCPGGKTSAAKVVVHNRANCCQSRLNLFSLDFVDAAGQADPLLTYKFAGSQQVYTVWGTRE